MHRGMHERFCWGKQEGKRQLGRRRRENNIKIDLRDIEWGGMDRNHVVHDRD
jgi:hypothetical protein